VLHQAFAAVQHGAGLWFGPETHHADSSEITPKSPNQAMQPTAGRRTTSFSHD
jgi:hypothetical protein